MSDLTSLAHELRAPLLVIKIETQLAARRAEIQPELCETLLAQVNRAIATVERLVTEQSPT